MKTIQRASQENLDKIEKYGWDNFYDAIFNQTMSTNRLIKEVGIPTTSGYRIVSAIKENPEILFEAIPTAKNRKLPKQNQRKFNLNDNFFDEENSLMAYWLGFLAADGYVPSDNNEVAICLATTDRKHLELWKKDIQAEKEIKDYQDNKGHFNSKLIVTSPHMREQLAKYGIVPNKTKVFHFPQNLDRQYWKDFIRGYFDGDGSIQYLNSNKAIRFNLIAYNDDILETIMDFFEEDYGIPRVNIQYSENKVPRIDYSTNSSKKLFQILYYPGCRCLERKYLKFVEAIKKNQENNKFQENNSLYLNVDDFQI